MKVNIGYDESQSRFNKFTVSSLYFIVLFKIFLVDDNGNKQQ